MALSTEIEIRSPRRRRFSALSKSSTRSSASSSISTSLSRIRRKKPRSAHLVAGEQARQEDRDQLFQRQEADARVPGRRTKRSTCGGSGSSAISGRLSSLRCSLRIAEKPPLGMNGKGMRRVDGERRQDREDLVDEVLVSSQVRSLVGELAARRARRCRPRAARPAGSPRRAAARPSGRGAVADRGELLGRRQAVVAEQRSPRLGSMSTRPATRTM